MRDVRVKIFDFCHYLKGMSKLLCNSCFGQSAITTEYDRIGELQEA